MNNKEKLLLIGVDYTEVMMRFSNQEQIYFKFLNKFCEDPSFSLLLEAYANKDAKKMEQCAHTLKGVCGNIGLSKMSELLQGIVFKLRQEASVDAVAVELEEVSGLYDTVVSVMKEQ